MRDIVKELKQKKERARISGGLKRQEAQHAKGKLTARERIEVLAYKDSFVEYDMFVEHRSTDFGMEKNKIPNLKQGQAIFFASFLRHRVAPVKKGIRRSLVMWFGGQPFK